MFTCTQVWQTFTRSQVGTFTYTQLQKAFTCAQLWQMFTCPQLWQMFTYTQLWHLPVHKNDKCLPVNRCDTNLPKAWSQFTCKQVLSSQFICTHILWSQFTCTEVWSILTFTDQYLPVHECSSVTSIHPAPLSLLKRSLCTQTKCLNTQCNATQLHLLLVQTASAQQPNHSFSARAVPSLHLCQPLLLQCWIHAFLHYETD